MKRIVSVVLCAALLLGITPMLAFPRVTAEDQEEVTGLIIENADFETTADDEIPGWALLSGVIMPSGELAITDAEHRSGSHSLSITPISTFSTTKTSVVYSGVILGIRDGYTYTASAYFKGNIVPSISIRFYNMYSVEVTSATVKATGEATADWTRLEVSGTVPSGVLFARVLVEGCGDGTLYVDDVDITEDPLPDGQSKPVAYGTQVPDGSFEKAAAGKDTPWVLEQSGSGKWLMESSDQVGRMENSVDGTTTALRFYSFDPLSSTPAFTTMAIPVTPGETYSYSLQSRSSKADYGINRVYIKYYNSADVPGVATCLSYSTNSDRARPNWGTQNGSLVAPAGATHMRIEVQLPKLAAWNTGEWGTTRWTEIDNLVVTDSAGNVVFEDDFSEEVNSTKEALKPANITTDGTTAVKMGAGRLVGGNVPILQGKEYTLTADINSNVYNSVALIMEYYNQKGLAIRTYYNANTTTDTAEQVSVTSVAPDTAVYMKPVLLVTTGTAYIDNVQMYAITDSISNFSFEQVNAYAGSGNFPMQWRTEGDVDAWSVSSPKNDMPNRTMGLKVTGNGSVYSSMMKATAGESYLARIQASSANGGGLRLAFFDANFKAIGAGELTSFAGKAWTRYAASGTAPANTAYVAFELVAAEGDDFRVDAADFSAALLDIGDDTQMFLDDYVLASMDGFDRVFHEGVDAGTVLTKDDAGPWEKNGPYVYGTAFYDEEEQIYKMWYLGHNLVDASSYGGISWYTCYATSPDGINWTRPNLGLVEYGGNTDNNIVNTVHLASVFKQSKEDEPDDAKRYIMIYQDFELLEANGGSAPTYSYAYSSDGIHWGKGTTFTPGWDVITAGWDDDNKQFITLQKVNIHGRRDQHFMTGTPDEWSVPLDAIALADIQDTLECYRADTYGTGFYVKDGNYFAFDWLFLIPGGADTNVTHIMDGYKDVRLGYSRDLTEDWQRPMATPIIPQGSKEDVRYTFSTVAYAIDVGDEIWLYTSGGDTDHGGQLVWDPVNQQYTTYYGNRSCELFITKWRADGFASLNAGSSTGVITTKSLLFDGNKLLLNANAAGGSIRVELLDENGDPIDGFTAAECDAITTDSVKHVVSWNGNNDLSALEDTAVQVRVYAENSEVYSFRFSDTAPSGYEPPTPIVETVLEYEAKELLPFSSAGYVRFAKNADSSNFQMFMSSDGAHYDQTYGSSGNKDALIHRFTAPSDGTLIIDTAFTTDGTANDLGIRSGNADWHADYPAKYAIADKDGKIVFPRNGEFGTVSYGNPAGIPQSDPVTIEVKAGDAVDFILLDTYGGGIPMFFEARLFMDVVAEENYVGGPNGSLTGTNFNQQGEGGWYYMYADSMELVTRVVGDTNADSVVDVCDVVKLKLLADTQPSNLSRYDMCVDGLLDEKDVNALRKYLLGLIPTPRFNP